MQVDLTMEEVRAHMLIARTSGAQLTDTRSDSSKDTKEEVKDEPVVHKKYDRKELEAMQTLPFFGI